MSGSGSGAGSRCRAVPTPASTSPRSRAPSTTGGSRPCPSRCRPTGRRRTPVASITKRPDGRWRARYRDAAGAEHAKHFARKLDGQRWLDEVTTAVGTGTYVSPKTARTTVAEWCETWLAGYATRRPSTVRQARVHVAQIKAEFGPMPLSAVRPAHVRSWTSRMREVPLSASYVYALHSRLAQVFADAVH